MGADDPFPRLRRKPTPVLAAQIARRRARDELERRVESSPGTLIGGAHAGIADRLDTLDAELERAAGDV